jgi:hypothetical protein
VGVDGATMVSGVVTTWGSSSGREQPLGVEGGAENNSATVAATETGR